MKGAIQLAAGEAEQSLSADFQHAGYRIELNATHGAERLTLNRAQIAAGSARLALSGSMNLAAAQSFDAKGEISRFNPAEFGEYPSARINAEFVLQGERTPGLEATLKFAVRDSQFRGERLSGNGDLVLTQMRIARSDAKLRLGPNQLALHGGFGARGDILNFRVDAPRLASLGPRFAGHLIASGVLRGEFRSPEIKATIEATSVKAPDNVAAGRLKAELRASVVDGAFAQPEATFSVKAVQLSASGGQRLANLEAQGEVQRGLDGRLKLGVAASGYRSPALSIDTARLAVAGTRGEHRIELSAKGDALDLSAQARGGIQQADSWSGKLQQIVNRGGYPLSLREPAALEIAPERFNLHDARFDIGAGIFEVGVFSLDREEITTRGVFRNFPTSYLTALGPKEMPIKSSLAVSGEWNIAATHTLNGVVSIRRDRGDLVVLRPETMSLQLSALELHIEARQNAVSARFDAAGSTLGTVSGRGETLIKKLSGSWQLPDTAPIAMQAQADLPSIAWASPLLPIDGMLGGRARLQLSASGSVAEPRIQGTLTGDALSFVLQESGFRLTDGRLRVTLESRGTVASPKLNAIVVAEGLDASIADLHLEDGTLRAEVTSDLEGEGSLAAKVELSALPFARVEAHLQTAYARKNGAWGLLASAPFKLNAQATAPSLGWVAAFIGPGATVEGSLQLAASADGTVADPQFQGTVAGDNLNVVLAQLGVDLEEGILRAEFEGKELFLREFRMRGGDGNLGVTGKIDLAQLSPVFNLRVKADRLRALNRPDRLLELTGAGNLQLSEKRLLATGAFTVNRGIIALPKTDTPQLADDVVIVGQEQGPDKRSAGFPASIDLKIDLGEQLYLSGRGIDARLAGEIRFISESRSPPRAVGVIRVVQGTYSAYGQRLTIERGILNFSGPIDNPNLDILAMRKNQPVEAGVEITGTALTPRATLVSNPNVPDTEKLSWLVLGHGLDGASRAEFDLIQAAAGALLSRGESATLQARVAQATGLDEVGLKGSGEGLQGAVLTLGKRISSRVYVSYEQGITGASNLVKIKYTLTPRWTVQTQAGSDSAVDVFYTLSFD